MTETLENIISGGAESSAPAPEPVVTTTEPTPSTQPRQPDGKFAPKPGDPVASPPPASTPQPSTAAAPEPAANTPPVVPRGAMEAERAKRQERDAEIAELRGQLNAFMQMQQAPKQPPQPAAPPPDPYADPEGYAQHTVREAITPIERAMEEQRHEFSQVMAVEKHGQETVTAALQAISQARGTPNGEADFQRIMKARLPYQELVTWHKKQTALTRFGDDPDAFEAQLRAKIMAEIQGAPPATPAQPGAPAAPAPVMPSNLASARNVGTRTGPAWSGPASLTDIFNRGKK